MKCSLKVFALGIGLVISAVCRITEASGKYNKVEHFDLRVLYALLTIYYNSFRLFCKKFTWTTEACKFENSRWVSCSDSHTRFSVLTFIWFQLFSHITIGSETNSNIFFWLIHNRHISDTSKFVSIDVKIECIYKYIFAELFILFYSLCNQVIW